MMTTSTVTDKSPRCAAKTGVVRSDYGFVPKYCHQERGLRSVTTRSGPVWFCAAPGHEARVRAMFAIHEPDAIDEYKRQREINETPREWVQHHEGYDLVIDDEEDGDPFEGREGMPEFNGAFR